MCSDTRPSKPGPGFGLVDFGDMGTDKRARQKANRQARLAEVEAEEAKEVREASTKKYGKIAAVVGGIIALVVLYSLLTGGNDNDGAVAEFAPTPAAEVTPTEVPVIVLSETIPDDFEPFSGNGGLANVVPAAKNLAYDSAPDILIDPTRKYAAVLDTTEGPIRLNLFADEAPIAVNSFVALARDGYFDGLTFHRVEPGFVIQGGDPLGNGMGGPGYDFVNEIDPERVFEGRGQLAMANAGADTNGSQFFITLSDASNVVGLTGRFTIFGELSDVDNAAAVDAIEAGGVGTVINSVRITEG